VKILRLDEILWDNIEERFRRTFVRVDFNVPMKDQKVVDDFRIRQALPTIRYLLEHKCIVILASHLGRPKGNPQDDREKYSLLPVAEKLAELLDHDVLFSEENHGEGVWKLISDGRPGRTVIMLENLRFDPREEKNDPDFGEALFKNCDLYVNDAFGASHRAHASIEAITHFSKIKTAGFLLSKEWEVLNQVLHHPLEPQMAVLGGAKITDKMQVIKSLMMKCKALFIGGRMGLTFLAAQGVGLGATSIEEDAIPLAKRLMGDARDHGVKLFFPVDGLGANKIDSSTAQTYRFGSPNDIPKSVGIFDIGPETLKTWTSELLKSKSIVWNGPMGVFENPAFAAGTLGLVDFLVAEKDRIKAVAGGGETVAAIMQRGAFDALHHVSTGGGAMLEFLEGKALPGFESLKLKDREVEAMMARMTGPLAS